MTNLNPWKMVCAVFVLCAATVTVAPGQVFTKLVDFDGKNGFGPYSTALVQGRDGTLYGTTAEGGSGKGTCPFDNGCGTVFKIDQTGNLTTEYRFCHSLNCMDGTFPQVGLLLAPWGEFYGTTDTTGASGFGTVFRIGPAGRLTTIHTFNGKDGAYPFAALIRAQDGNFYGTTASGGSDHCNPSCGTVFRMTPQGVVTTLYSFCSVDCSDGQSPYSSLVLGTDGNLYGTTSTGGTSQVGTVFRITLDGKLTTLHSFSGGADGGLPLGNLIQAADGDLYGTTLEGGANDVTGGTIFKVNLAGTKLTTIYSFCARTNCADGSDPGAGVIQGTDGNFYGNTYTGGDQNTGTIFQVTPGGVLTTLHDMDGADGTNPRGELFQGTDGRFYGLTHLGGDLLACQPPYGCGAVFRLDMGLGPFVSFVQSFGKVGQSGGILGQGFTGTTSVLLNGIPASFSVLSDTYLRATVPAGAITGYVTVTTPSGTLTSNVPFHVIR